MEGSSVWRSPILRVLAWASRATAAPVGGFSLLAVLVYVADEHPAIYAGAGARQASVVRLYGVVVILSRWVRVGCARLSRVHSSVPSFLWTGLRGASPPAGPFEKPSLVFECDGGVQLTPASWFAVWDLLPI